MLTEIGSADLTGSTLVYTSFEYMTCPPKNNKPLASSMQMLQSKIVILIPKNKRQILPNDGPLSCPLRMQESVERKLISES